MERVDFSEWFYYDESSPSFIKWKVDRVRGFDKKVFIYKGANAGSIGSDGYYRVKLNQKEYRCGRVVYELFNGPLESDYVIDHVDGNKLNNSISNLRAVSQVINRRNTSLDSRNKSGIAGVIKHEIESRGKLYFYWRGSYVTLDGKRCSKSFSIAKLGEEEAFRQACEFRTKMIEELNNQGAGYTDTHGKRKGVS